MGVTVSFPYERTLRRAAPRAFRRISDGDTPIIEQPIRMVSCDTPEKSGYAGKAATAQAKLDACRQRLESGFYPAIPAAMRNYLLRKLTATAAEKHIQAGELASQVCDQLLEKRLTRDDGSKRRLGVIPTGEIIDTYSRLLAYLTPWYAGTRGDPLPPRDDPARRTLNLDMIENGWAAFFPVYPSLPSNADMNLAIAAAEIAWNEKRGAWKEFGRNVLLAYEYRLCVKLGTAGSVGTGMKPAFQRICVDLRTLKEVGMLAFHKVPSCYRLWVWQDDIARARTDLGLR